MATSWVPSTTSDPIDRGLSARSPDHPPDAHGKLANGANAYLETMNGQRVGLWINEITADFELAGSTGQGPTRRDFYPHNFTQPSLNLSGQTTNNYEYNRIADFTRQSQFDALSLQPGGYPLRFECLMPGTATRNRTTRGRHNDVSVVGFIPKISKGATRFVTAHTYQFQFVILAAFSLLGLEDEITQSYLTQQTITQRLEAGRDRLARRKATKQKPVPTSAAQQDDPRPIVQPASQVIAGIDPSGPFGPLTG